MILSKQINTRFTAKHHLCLRITIFSFTANLRKRNSHRVINIRSMKSTVYYLLFNHILFGIVTALPSILDKDEIGDGDSFKVVCDVTYITTEIVDPESEDACVINRTPVGSINYQIMYISTSPPETFPSPPGRTFIFKRNVNPGEHKQASVEVKDALCSDACTYHCFCKDVRGGVYRVQETLRKKASCYHTTTTSMTLTENVTSDTSWSSKKGTGMFTTRRTPQNAGMDAIHGNLFNMKVLEPEIGQPLKTGCNIHTFSPVNHGSINDIVLKYMCYSCSVITQLARRNFLSNVTSVAEGQSRFTITSDNANQGILIQLDKASVADSGVLECEMMFTDFSMVGYLTIINVKGPESRSYTAQLSDTSLALHIFSSVMQALQFLAIVVTAVLVGLLFKEMRRHRDYVISHCQLLCSTRLA